MNPMKLDKTIWDKIPVNSSKGFDPLFYLAQVIEKTFPGFEPGFFSDEDVESRRVEEGYIVLTKEHWVDVADWNERVALRYGIREENGGLRWKNLYICVRPKDWGARRQAKKIQESEERFAVAATAKAREIASVAHGPGVLDTGAAKVETHSPQPPELYADSGWDGSEASQEVFENATKSKPEPVQKRGPGRPKKVAGKE